MKVPSPQGEDNDLVTPSQTKNRPHYSPPVCTPLSPTAAQEVLLREGDPSDPGVQQMLSRIEDLTMETKTKAK